MKRKKPRSTKKPSRIEQTKKELENKQKLIDEKKSQVDAAHENMIAELEKVSQMTKEEAKNLLIENIEDEAKREAVKYVREIEAQAKDEADKKAKDIVSLAVQRCAVDHSAEITVSVVNLPNDDMKGRITA